MLSYYRRIRLSTRLIALGLAEALVFAVVLRNYPQEVLLPAICGTAAALVVLDSAIRRAPAVLAPRVKGDVAENLQGYAGVYGLLVDKDG